MTAIDLAGFAAKFAADADPWETFTKRDEAVKRRAILHALGPGPIGRVLELASGNGSNSAVIARRALRLDATEGTVEGTRLTAKAIASQPRAMAHRLILPGRPPRNVYDAVLIAELLYYLSPADMTAVARMVGRILRPGGRIVLAHHRVDFYDFVQHAKDIDRCFTESIQRQAHMRRVAGNSRWTVFSTILR